MKKIIFTFDPNLSKQHGQFIITLMAANKSSSGWDLEAKGLNRRSGDLHYLADHVADKMLFKMALESEFGIRKLEIRPWVDPSKFELLRINVKVLADFITRCQRQGILTDKKGRLINFKILKDVVPDLVIRNDKFELLLDDRPFCESRFILTFIPVTLVFENQIIQLDSKITYPFLKEIPIGKVIPKNRREKLLIKYLQHEDKLRVCPSDKIIVLKEETIKPILNFNSALKRAQLFFAYDTVLVPDKAPAKVVAGDKKDLKVCRNFQLEAQFQDVLKKTGFFLRPKETFNWFLSGTSLDFVYDELLHNGFSIRVNHQKLVSPTDLKWKISCDHHHIFMDGTLFLEKAKMRSSALFDAAYHNQAYFKTSNGAYGIISAAIKKLLLDLSKIGVLENGRFKFSRCDFAYIDRQFSIDEKIDADQDYQKLQFFAGNFNNIKRYFIPASLKSVLRRYQVLGVNWLRTMKDLGLNGILSDDMGLGKTLQVLSFLESLRQENQLRYPVLLILPKTLIFNWQEEIKKFTPDLSYYVLSKLGRSGGGGWQKTHHIVMTTYGIVRRHIDTFCRSTWEYVILDEAQAIKNPDAKVTKAVKRIKCRHKLSITGTPVENSTMDLWSQFDFLMPGFLYRKKTFNRKYSQAKEDLNALHLRTRPYILRRLKSQVARQLPAKTEIIQLCDFTRDQKKAYDKALRHARHSIEKKDFKSSSHILELILRLRQIACHPALALRPERKVFTSGKLSQVINSGRQILSEGHKILVFSQFTEHLRLVKNAFAQYNSDYFYLDGKTVARESVIHQFKRHKDPCLFFISLKTGGTGLNLSEANYVFLLDPWWNPAVENQAIDRTHRIGQKQPVFVYRFITKGSIEEKVNELKMVKQQIENSVIDKSDPINYGFENKILNEKIIKQLFGRENID